MKKKQFLYRDIEDFLMDLIAQNQNKAGVKMPTEKALCIKFNASRVTVRKAVEQLVEEGYLYRQRGSGVFISGKTPTIMQVPLSEAQQSDKAVGKSTIKITEPIHVSLLLASAANNFFQEIIEGASEYLKTKNSWPPRIVFTEYNQELENRAIKEIMAERMSKGIIICPLNDEQYNKELFMLAMNGFPIVILDHFFDGFDVSTVGTDHFESAKRATEYLIKKGRKNIGLIQGKSGISTTLKERHAGFQKAHIDNNRLMQTKHELLYSRKDEKSMEEMIEKFLKKNKKLDALISTGDNVGLDLYRVSKRLGIKVPDDMEIIFYDDNYKWFADLLPFSPTVMAQHNYEIGYEAAKILINLITNPKAKTQTLRLPATLIPGQSTGD
ncbi:MAG: GntR family transcriptional regulator [Spirochaetaceae bacterium]|jgi:GntR family transcriptional regulator of arabinose operon|nr:GntR family transcriptional regulator [Spirochaetaceae bacterium]